MEKFIPYEKLSKKEKRKLDSARRTTWGEFSPVTRKPQNSKAYNRKKAQNWRKELPNSVPFILENQPPLLCFFRSAFRRRRKVFFCPFCASASTCQETLTAL